MRRVVTALVAITLLAGCGGDEKNDFAEDWKPVNEQLLALDTQITQALVRAEGTPDDVLAGIFLGFSTRLQDAKRRVDELDPPADLSRQTTAVSRTTGAVVTDLRAIGTAARTHKPQAARTATEALVRDLRTARSSRQALDRKTGD